jgi:hypothetical protein
VHRRWVAEAFAPQLAAHPGPADALVDVLVVATDLYAWALLRRDARLDAATTAARMSMMVRALSGRGCAPRTARAPGPS